MAFGVILLLLEERWCSRQSSAVVPSHKIQEVRQPASSRPRSSSSAHLSVLLVGRPIPSPGHAHTHLLVVARPHPGVLFWRHLLSFCSMDRRRSLQICTFQSFLLNKVAFKS